MHIISTNKAPAAIGPYAQGIKAGGIVMTSGQLPVDPVTGMMPAAMDAQTLQSLENVRSIIEAAGLFVDNIIKTTLFVKDLNEFSAINTAYEAFFTKHGTTFPARSCVEVARLPKDAKIEIEAIAIFDLALLPPATY